ncbi:DinB family protein [Spirosoma sp. KUDC1026]|uniref:DinB family protein n=1 Tax=Spirosoma sp. KUDC1026 TaxID=2745947 RepID=UPI00159BC4A9|nr:DinB family protein [Spirosoma sp. KUDC1026]QKZ13386.1 DinB family protein [Spirosoma sp. KUDC1026]
MHKLETARQLQSRLDRILDTVTREFSPLSAGQLRFKLAPDRWSILECLQHLNLAERFYIRNIQHKVDRLGLVQTSPTDQTFVSSWVGKAMRYMVDPQTKMKVPTPGILRPRRVSELDATDVLNQFIELQTLLRDLLNKAIYLDWNQESLSTLFGNWLTIRLGDAILMLVAHTERHINQAMRVKAEMSNFVA